MRDPGLHCTHIRHQRPRCADGHGLRQVRGHLQPAALLGNHEQQDGAEADCDRLGYGRYFCFSSPGVDPQAEPLQDFDPQHVLRQPLALQALL